MIYVCTQKSCHQLWYAFPSPESHRLCRAEIQPVLPCQGNAGISLQPLRLGTGAAVSPYLSTLTGTALLKPKDDWNVNCFQDSVSSLAWLKEKPQGIYLKADKDPPYSRSKQTNSINFSRLGFSPWKSESSESALSSLVQPNMEKPTLQDGKLAMKYMVNTNKGAMTDIRITLLCLCSGRCRIPADH